MRQAIGKIGGIKVIDAPASFFFARRRPLPANAERAWSRAPRHYFQPLLEQRNWGPARHQPFDNDQRLSTPAIYSGHSGPKLNRPIGCSRFLRSG
jgi:hypothetical protein